MMKKINFLFVTALILLSGQLNLRAKEKSDNRKPNYILIVADDLGYGDLGFTGSTQISTPSIDKLAEEGVVCTQGYVSSAVCSPSRAGLLTGINQVNFGYDNNLATSDLPKGCDPEYAGLPIQIPTVAKQLKDLGYSTGFLGKWHLGEKEQFHPMNRGFEEMWGYLGGGHDYFESKPNGRGYKAPIISNFTDKTEITYITDDIGNQACDYIDRHRDEPFFLYVSFNAPHAPLQATEADLELFSHIKDKKRRTYLAMVHRMDVNIGKIMDKLKRADIDNNTMTIFISDNGGPVKSNASINAPFRGAKGSLLEGGIHIPFVVHYPKEIEEGSIYNSTVTSLDITPTFVANAGGVVTDESEFTGVDIIPYLKGVNKEEPHHTLYWRFTISGVIREGKWKLIRLPDRLPLLFDLESDISEQNNVAMENIDITERLLKKFGTWDITRPHTLFFEGPVWRKFQLAHYDRDDYQLVQPEQ